VEAKKADYLPAILHVKAPEAFEVSGAFSFQVGQVSK
jgi:hypothetical protein